MTNFEKDDLQPGTELESVPESSDAGSVWKQKLYSWNYFDVCTMG